MGVETTCKKHDWNTRSIWNDIVLSPAYRRFKSRQVSKYAKSRINHRKFDWVSRKFPLEKKFSDHIESLLIRFGIDFEREPKVKAGLSRSDFRIHLTLVECKSDVSTMAMNKALGQCWIYKVIAGEVCMVVIPDDVTPRVEWLEAFSKMEVRVLNESGFVQLLKGELPLTEVRGRQRKRAKRRK